MVIPPALVMTILHHFSPTASTSSQNSSKEQVIDQLIDYASKKSDLKTLLVQAKKHNPNKYEKYQPYEYSNAAAAVDFQPSVNSPLVYHLHGLDTNPSSLVLTEEDYFEFFEHISKDLDQPKVLPTAVHYALGNSSLLMLGYDLHSWDFRILFGGPIKRLYTKRRPANFSIQLEPQPEAGIEDTEQFRYYLDKYFGYYKFSIFWGDVTSFTRELWSLLKA